MVKVKGDKGPEYQQLQFTDHNYDRAIETHLYPGKEVEIHLKEIVKGKYAVDRINFDIGRHLYKKRVLEERPIELEQPPQPQTRPGHQVSPNRFSEPRRRNDRSVPQRPEQGRFPGKSVSPFFKRRMQGEERGRQFAQDTAKNSPQFRETNTLRGHFKREQTNQHERGNKSQSGRFSSSRLDLSSSPPIRSRQSPDSHRKSKDDHARQDRSSQKNVSGQQPEASTRIRRQRNQHRRSRIPRHILRIQRLATYLHYRRIRGLQRSRTVIASRRRVNSYHRARIATTRRTQILEISP